MTIKALYPTVRPTLNLDFAKTTALDPRITFTRASTAAFVGSDGLIQTAASGAPRFDHNPATGESLGLLVEEARTNLALYSEQLDNAYWNKTLGGNTSTIGANLSTAPDGTATADKIVTTINNAIHGVQKVGITITSGAAYTVSFYAKAAGWSRVGVRAGNSSADFSCTVNLSTGAVIASAGTAIVQALPSGWYRVSISGIASGVNGEITIEAHNTSTVQSNETGDGTSGILVWGAQLEAGAFPTSYIPTVASTVTRAADVASMTGTNFSSWYNADQSTCFIETKQVDDTGGSGAWYFGPGGSPRWWSYSYGYTQAFDGVSSGGVVNTGYAGSRSLMKYAVLINNTNQTHVGAINGLAPVAGIWDSIAGSITQLDLGYRRDNLEYLNGRISRFTYYPVSLTNTQLQALTAT